VEHKVGHLPCSCVYVVSYQYERERRKNAKYTQSIMELVLIECRLRLALSQEVTIESVMFE
jgi:hypothetical protein